MSRISDRRPLTSRGFTLAEVIVASSLSLIVLSGILAAYLFLGRNLTRLVNVEGQDVKSRHALRQFTNDVSTAVSFVSITSSNLTFTVPATLTNCSTTYGSATITCDSTTVLQNNLTNLAPWSIAPAVWGTGPLALTNCSTTVGSATVTCTSTNGMQTGVAISGTGVPSNTIVNSITNATTFVMSANASATNTGATLATTVKCIPDNAVVDSPLPSVTPPARPTFVLVLAVNGVPVTPRTLAPAIATTTGAALSTVDGLSYVYAADSTGNTKLTRTDFKNNVTTTLLTDIDPSASSGFGYYNASGATASSTTNVKEVGFSLATKVGTLAVGTEARYVTVSPRVVVHNKSVLQ